MLKYNIKIFSNQRQLVKALADEWLIHSQKALTNKMPFTVVLPGGKTPKSLYQQMTVPYYRNKIPWEIVHLFWGDERCVPFDHNESNYRMVWDSMLRYLPIPSENIHRINGEKNPSLEALRYSKEIGKYFINNKNEFGHFDWVLLGMGTDGHTASLFPGSDSNEREDKSCVACVHPIIKQKRITMTLSRLSKTKRATFIVTGKEKASIVSQVINCTEGIEKFPAAGINPIGRRVELFLDKEAASEL